MVSSSQRSSLTILEDRSLRRARSREYPRTAFRSTPIDALPTPPARRGLSRSRFFVGLAAGAAACFLALFLTAAAIVAVQAWLKPLPVEFADLKPAVGEPAPVFVLKDLDGKDYRLSDRLGRTPLVIEFGSATCPYCVGAAEGMDDLARRDEGKAEFLFIYCREAHPDEAGMRMLTSQEELPVLPQTREGEDRAGRRGCIAPRSSRGRACWWMWTALEASRTCTEAARIR